MENNIAVVYIARGLDPNWQARCQRFISSYIRHPPGIDHELYILYKHFVSPNDLAWTRGQFASLSPVEILDAIDTQTFGVMVDCYRVNEPILCPLMATTEIMQDDWLKRLYTVFASPGVGIVGCTGSRVSTLHVRDTACLVNLAQFLSIASQFDFRTSKEGWLMFEHGPDNLTQQIMRSGKKVFVVEKERVLSPEEWPSSTTYQGNLQNVLVHDRGARDYKDL